MQFIIAKPNSPLCAYVISTDEIWSSLLITKLKNNYGYILMMIENEDAHAATFWLR